MSKWTERSVREQLPDVKVRLGDSIISAKVSGRLNGVATVSVFYRDGSLQHRDLPFSWPSIVHALNTDSPLNFE